MHAPDHTVHLPYPLPYTQYRTYLKGSSTVCLALMKPGRVVEIANVGDSGVRILRDGKVIFATEVRCRTAACGTRVPVRRARGRVSVSEACAMLHAEGWGKVIFTARDRALLVRICPTLRFRAAHLAHQGA